jgi:hypothetical protein
MREILSASKKLQTLKFAHESQRFRQFAVSYSGKYMMVPIIAIPGDTICVAFGCDTPLVLRPCGSHYEFIGDCFVDGLMLGEGMEGVIEKDITTFNIR